MTNKLFKIDENKKYFWSPVSHWKKNDDILIIDGVKYEGVDKELFPEFYFFMQEGAIICEIIKRFTSVDSKSMQEFIELLIKRRVLVSDILTPEEIFSPQNIMYASEYNEEDFYDKDKLNQFKDMKLNRVLYDKAEEFIDMEYKKYPSFIEERRTCRTFDTEHKIDKIKVEEIVSVFKQNRIENEIYYNYASAGGLYPIDIYLYIKDKRVEGIEGGLYYYSTIKNSLVLISKSCVITEEAHLFTNKNMFKESAISMFFVYNAEVTMPKYGGLAYYYASIDTGIMVGLLSVIAEINDIGLCSIGNMNFKKIKKYFKLISNQVLLHSIELGIKKK